MQTDGMTEVLLPLNKKQKAACSAVMGVMLVAVGVILALSGAGVIPVSAGSIAAPTVLFGVGLSILFSAVVAKNSISMWLSGIILACAAATLFAAVTPAGYSELYPIFIAAPGIGCVFSIWFAQAKMPPLKVMLFFGGLGAVFSLSSSGACSWGITGGVLAAYFGLWILCYALEKFLKKDKEDA